MAYEGINFGQHLKHKKIEIPPLCLLLPAVGIAPGLREYAAYGHAGSKA